MAAVHLSGEGRDQAQTVARAFAGRSIARILSSPLERCRETAQPVADLLGLDVVVEPALNEIDCGRWTGMDFPSLAADPAWHAWNADRTGGRMPGGESAVEVQDRTMALIARLAATDGGPTLLTTHSDVVKTVVLTLIGAPLDHYGRIVVDPASITTLDLWPGGGKVVRLNEQAPA